MQNISTNDCFHHICRLLQIHKDRELLIDIFHSAGLPRVNKQRIKQWDRKTSSADERHTEMPRHILDKFIDELYKRKLAENVGGTKQKPGN